MFSMLTDLIDTKEGEWFGYQHRSSPWHTQHNEGQLYSWTVCRRQNTPVSWRQEKEAVESCPKVTGLAARPQKWSQKQGHLRNWLTALVQFSWVQSLSCVRLFTAPWTAARQASLSITNSRSLLKLMSIESVIPSNHLILCHPLLLSPSIFLSIRVFSIESALRIRWPKYWSFSFRISLSNEYSGLISFRMDRLDLLWPPW